MFCIRYQAASQVQDPIDDPNLNAHKYGEEILVQSSLGALLRHCNQVGTEARAYDADLRMLVYENYSKFIGATDVIKEMNSDGAKMQNELKTVHQTVLNLERAIDTNQLPNSPKSRNDDAEGTDGSNANNTIQNSMSTSTSKEGSTSKEEEGWTATASPAEMRRCVRAKCSCTA